MTNVETNLAEKLSNHIKENNHFQVIDISNKAVTERVAIAYGEINVGSEVLKLIQAKNLPKGDVLALAEIAGINGAKQAHQMIPMCHPLALEQVIIHSDIDIKSTTISVFCLARAYEKTGVEMEALAGVNAALLTIYDLSKGTNPDVLLSNVHLVMKSGGKKGLWLSPRPLSTVLQSIIDNVSQEEKKILAHISAAIITISDRASKKLYADESGELLVNKLSKLGANVIQHDCVADDIVAIQESIRKIIAKYSPELIITTGGTGFTPRDVTPEAITPLINKVIPGIAEKLRYDGAKSTDFSWLSRSIVGVIDKTLVITLPGSRKAVVQGLDSLKPLLKHALHMVQGGSHD